MGLFWGDLRSVAGEQGAQYPFLEFIEAMHFKGNTAS